MPGIAAASARGSRTLSATTTEFPPAQGLWGGRAGTYAGVEPFALGPEKLKKLYGPAALGRAKAWTKDAKVSLTEWHVPYCCKQVQESLTVVNELKLVGPAAAGCYCCGLSNI